MGEAGSGCNKLFEEELCALGDGDALIWDITVEDHSPDLLKAF